MVPCKNDTNLIKIFGKVQIRENEPARQVRCQLKKLKIILESWSCHLIDSNLFQLHFHTLSFSLSFSYLCTFSPTHFLTLSLSFYYFYFLLSLSFFYSFYYLSIFYSFSLFTISNSFYFISFNVFSLLLFIPNVSFLSFSISFLHTRLHFLSRLIITTHVQVWLGRSEESFWCCTPPSLLAHFFTPQLGETTFSSLAQGKLVVYLSILWLEGW